MAYNFPIARKLLAFAGRARRNWLDAAPERRSTSGFTCSASRWRSRACRCCSSRVVLRRRRDRRGLLPPVGRPPGRGERRRRVHPGQAAARAAGRGRSRHSTQRAASDCEPRRDRTPAHRTPHRRLPRLRRNLSHSGQFPQIPGQRAGTTVSTGKPVKFSRRARPMVKRSHSVSGDAAASRGRPDGGTR